MKSALPCLFIAGLLHAGSARADDAPAPAIDNAQVTVRDIALTPGTPGPVLEHAGDYVVIYFDGGRIRNHLGQVTRHEAGSAAFGHGGTTGDVALGAPAREIVIDLKDGPPGTVPNTSGFPPGFPRPGSKKILENGRIIVWNYAWVPGQPTPMHFHDKNVVVMYRGDGPLKSTAPDGTSVVNRYHAGEIRFNLANRSHTEELTEGAQSAVMVELK